MASRRRFLAGGLAAAALPRATWAEAGNPDFLAAARTMAGDYVLCGLSLSGEILFSLPLPDRGHAAAAHPGLPQAVAFARRPGTYAIVLDCRNGTEIARLNAPEGRHFYGHGTFSADGSLLFTTENDYDAGQGTIGVWDARNGYARKGEFSSGGVGPHDIHRMPDGETLVVANGGIETHPDTGRLKLNIPDMRPNLSYLTLDGGLLETLELEAPQQKNSIRHLAVSAQGAVAFAMQWQGHEGADLPMLGVHNREKGTLDLLQEASVLQMKAYLGSVAISADGSRIATTSPRAGLLQEFAGAGLTRAQALEDVSGVAFSPDGFVVTTGKGVVVPPKGNPVAHPLSWDNHLIAL